MREYATGRYDSTTNNSTPPASTSATPGRRTARNTQSPTPATSVPSSQVPNNSSSTTTTATTAPLTTSPTSRTYEDYSSKSSGTHLPNHDTASCYSPSSVSSPPPSRNVKSRLSSRSPAASMATSPSREVTLIDDRAIPDLCKRRQRDLKDLVVRVSDRRPPYESPHRSQLRSVEASALAREPQDPRLALKRDDHHNSSGDERNDCDGRPLKKGKYVDSNYDKNHILKRMLDSNDITNHTREAPQNFRRPYDARKAGVENNKFRSREEMRSPSSDPRTRKNETDDWRTRETLNNNSEAMDYMSDSSQPSTPTRDERDDNTHYHHMSHQPVYGQHSSRLSNSPMNLPLPRFAQQIRGICSGTPAALITSNHSPISCSPKAISDNVYNSNVTTPLALQQSPVQSSSSSDSSHSSAFRIPISTPLTVDTSAPGLDDNGLILADTPVSPGPAAQPSDSEESPLCTNKKDAELEERIKALDERYEKWTGTSRSLAEKSSFSNFQPNRKFVVKVDERFNASDIARSVLSRRSIFDDDVERLENVNEKYEPRPYVSSGKNKFNTPVSSATSSCSKSTVSKTCPVSSTKSVISTIASSVHSVSSSSSSGIRSVSVSKQAIISSHSLVQKSISSTASYSSAKNTLTSSSITPATTIADIIANTTIPVPSATPITSLPGFRPTLQNSNNASGSSSAITTTTTSTTSINNKMSSKQRGLSPRGRGGTSPLHPSKLMATMYSPTGSSPARSPDNHFSMMPSSPMPSSPLINNSLGQASNSGGAYLNSDILASPGSVSSISSISAGYSTPVRKNSSSPHYSKEDCLLSHPADEKTAIDVSSSGNSRVNAHNSKSFSSFAASLNKVKASESSSYQIQDESKCKIPEKPVNKAHASNSTGSNYSKRGSVLSSANQGEEKSASPATSKPEYISKSSVPINYIESKDNNIPVRNSHEEDNQETSVYHSNMKNNANLTLCDQTNNNMDNSSTPVSQVHKKRRHSCVELTPEDTKSRSERDVKSKGSNKIVSSELPLSKKQRMNDKNMSELSSSTPTDNKNCTYSSLHSAHDTKIDLSGDVEMSNLSSNNNSKKGSVDERERKADKKERKKDKVLQEKDKLHEKNPRERERTLSGRSNDGRSEKSMKKTTNGKDAMRREFSPDVHHLEVAKKNSEEVKEAEDSKMEENRRRRKTSIDYKKEDATVKKETSSEKDYGSYKKDESKAVRVDERYEKDSNVCKSEVDPYVASVKNEFTEHRSTNGPLDNLSHLEKESFTKKEAKKDKIKSDIEKKKHPEDLKSRDDKKDKLKDKKEKFKIKDKYKSVSRPEKENLREKSRIKSGGGSSNSSSVDKHKDKIRERSDHHSSSKEISITQRPDDRKQRKIHKQEDIKLEKKERRESSASHSDEINEARSKLDEVSYNFSASNLRPAVTDVYETHPEQSNKRRDSLDIDSPKDHISSNTQRKKHDSGKSDKLSDVQHRSKTDGDHKTIKSPSKNSLFHKAREEEVGFEGLETSSSDKNIPSKIDLSLGSDDDCLKMGSPSSFSSIGSKKKQRNQSTSSCGIRKGSSSKKKIEDFNASASDSDSEDHSSRNSSDNEDETRKNISLFDEPVIDTNFDMYDKVKSRHLKLEQKREEERLKEEAKQRMIQQYRAKARSKKKKQTASTSIGSDSDSHDEVIGKKNMSQMVASSSEDDRRSSIHHLTSDYSDDPSSILSSQRKQDKIRKKISSRRKQNKESKSSRQVRGPIVSDISSDETALKSEDISDYDTTPPCKKITASKATKHPRPALSAAHVPGMDSSEKELKNKRIPMKVNSVFNTDDSDASVIEDVKPCKPKYKNELPEVNCSYDQRFRRDGRIKEIFGYISEDSDSSTLSIITPSKSPRRNTSPGSAVAHRKGSVSSARSYNSPRAVSASPSRPNLIANPFSDSDESESKRMQEKMDLYRPGKLPESKGISKIVRDIGPDSPKKTVIHKAINIIEAAVDDNRPASDSGKGSSGAGSSSSSSSSCSIGSAIEDTLLLPQTNHIISSPTRKEEKENVILEHNSIIEPEIFRYSEDEEQRDLTRKKKKKKHKDKESSKSRKRNKESSKFISQSIEDDTVPNQLVNSEPIVTITDDAKTPLQPLHSSVNTTVAQSLYSQKNSSISSVPGALSSVSQSSKTNFPQSESQRQPSVDEKTMSSPNCRMDSPKSSGPDSSQLKIGNRSRSISHDSRNSFEQTDVPECEPEPALDMPLIKSDSDDDVLITSERVDSPCLKSPAVSNSSKTGGHEESPEVAEAFEDLTEENDRSEEPVGESLQQQQQAGGSSSKASRAVISQEETLNAVAGLLASYGSYSEEPPNSSQEEDSMMEPNNVVDEDPDEAQKAAQILQSEMPEEERDPRDSSWNREEDPVIPVLSDSPCSTSLEACNLPPTEATDDVISLNPDSEQDNKVADAPEPSFSPKKQLEISSPEKTDDKKMVDAITFPDSPTSVQSEPALQIDEDQMEAVEEMASHTSMVFSPNSEKSAIISSAEHPTPPQTPWEEGVTLPTPSSEVVETSDRDVDLSNKGPDSKVSTNPSSEPANDDASQPKVSDHPKESSNDSRPSRPDIGDSVTNIEMSPIDKSESEDNSEKNIDQAMPTLAMSPAGKSTPTCLSPAPTDNQTCSETKSKEEETTENTIIDAKDEEHSSFTTETGSEAEAEERKLTETHCDHKPEDLATSQFSAKKETLAEDEDKSSAVDADKNVLSKPIVPDNIKEEKKPEVMNMMAKDETKNDKDDIKTEVPPESSYTEESFENSLNESTDDSKIDLEDSKTDDSVILSPRGRSRGRGKRGRGRGSSPGSAHVQTSPNRELDSNFEMPASRASGTSRGRKVRTGRDQLAGGLPIVDQSPETIEPRRSSRPKRVRRHPDMVDHGESSNKRRRSARGARGTLRPSSNSHDVFEFRESDDDIGLGGVVAKGKKDRSVSQSKSPAKEGFEDDLLDAPNTRKSRRLQKKVVDDDDHPIPDSVASPPVVPPITISTTNIRGKGKDMQKRTVRVNRVSAITINPSMTASQINNNNNLKEGSIIDSNNDLKVIVQQNATSSIATLSPVTPVTPVSSSVNVLQLPADAAKLQNSGSMSITRVVPSATTQSSSAQPHLVVTGSPVQSSSPTVVMTQVSASSIIPSSIGVGSKDSSELPPTPLVDPVTGHLTPMTMVKEGQYIPVSGEIMSSKALTLISLKRPGTVERIVPMSSGVTLVPSPNQPQLSPSQTAAPMSTKTIQVLTSGGKPMIQSNQVISASSQIIGQQVMKASQQSTIVMPVSQTAATGVLPSHLLTKANFVSNAAPLTVKAPRPSLSQAVVSRPPQSIVVTHTSVGNATTPLLVTRPGITRTSVSHPNLVTRPAMVPQQRGSLLVGPASPQIITSKNLSLVRGGAAVLANRPELRISPSVRPQQRPPAPASVSQQQTTTILLSQGKPINTTALKTVPHSLISTGPRTQTTVSLSPSITVTSVPSIRLQQQQQSPNQLPQSSPLISTLPRRSEVTLEQVKPGAITSGSSALPATARHVAISSAFATQQKVIHSSTAVPAITTTVRRVASSSNQPITTATSSYHHHIPAQQTVHFSSPRSHQQSPSHISSPRGQPSPQPPSLSSANTPLAHQSSPQPAHSLHHRDSPQPHLLHQPSPQPSPQPHLPPTAAQTQQLISIGGGASPLLVGHLHPGHSPATAADRAAVAGQQPLPLIAVSGQQQVNSEQGPPPPPPAHYGIRAHQQQHALPPKVDGPEGHLSTPFDMVSWNTNYSFSNSYHLFYSLILLHLQSS